MSPSTTNHSNPLQTRRRDVHQKLYLTFTAHPLKWPVPQNLRPHTLLTSRESYANALQSKALARVLVGHLTPTCSVGGSAWDLPTLFLWTKTSHNTPHQYSQVCGPGWVCPPSCAFGTNLAHISSLHLASTLNVFSSHLHILDTCANSLTLVFCVSSECTAFLHYNTRRSMAPIDCGKDGTPNRRI
jgi:hypothetical protein